MLITLRWRLFVTCTIGLLLFLSVHVGAQEVIGFNRSNSGLVDNHVNTLVVMQGAPLVATSKGVSLRQPDRWETWRIGENGLPDAPVTSAVVFGGSLWVGTFGKGIARLSDNRWKSFSQTDSGLMDDFVTALAGWGTRLVIGTREGVSLFDGMLWNRIPLDGVNGPIQITCLVVARELLLVGTAQGLFLVDGTLKSRRLDLGVSPPPWIQAVAAGSELLYVAHDGGLAFLQPDGRPALAGFDRSQIGRIYSVAATERDVVCGTNHGLVRVSPGSGVSRINIPEFGSGEMTVSALLEVGGDWYVGTTGNGVFRIPGSRLTGGGMPVPANVGPATSGGSVRFSEVRVFPPPGGDVSRSGTSPSSSFSSSAGSGAPTAVSQTIVDPRSMIPKVPEGAAGDRPGTVPFWTLHKRPPKPSNLTYFKDVLPMIVKKCLACHTTGTGKYFPLNDPKIVIPYFRKAGTDRFEQFLQEGGGMFGLVDPADAELIKIWVMEGCRE